MGRDIASGRLEALSDGVFAFAATLLVVSLEVPHTFSELSSELYGFIGFGLSFGALLLIWAVHHAYFRRFPYADAWTIALNGLLLFVVLFYVYPLKFMTSGIVSNLLPAGGERVVISDAGQLAQVFELYGAGFVGVFLAVSLLYRHAVARAMTFGLDAEEVIEARTLCRHYLLFVLAGLISVGIALAGIGVRYGLPGWAYALLGPLCWAHGRWSNRHNARLRASGGP